LENSLENYHLVEKEELIVQIAHKDLKVTEELADCISILEENVSDDLWGIPNYFDMLFIK
jgi:glutamine synthetase type III